MRPPGTARAVPAAAPIVSPRNRRRSTFKQGPRLSSVTGRAVGRDARTPVTVQIILHPETLDALRGSDGGRNRPVADRALDLGGHDVPSVRIENVSRLAEERGPFERSAGPEKPDELLLLFALSHRILVTRSADVRSRETREGLLLEELVARSAGELQFFNVLLVVEGDRLPGTRDAGTAAPDRDSACQKKECNEGQDCRRPGSPGLRAPIRISVFHHRSLSGEVLKKEMRSQTSVSARVGQGRPRSWACLYMAGPWRHSAAASAMELNDLPRPRRLGASEVPSAAGPWQRLHPRPANNISPTLGEPPGSG